VLSVTDVNLITAITTVIIATKLALLIDSLLQGRIGCRSRQGNQLGVSRCG
jgi:hypothetical protein